MVAASHDGSESRDQNKSDLRGSSHSEDVGEAENIRPFQNERPREDFAEAKSLLHSVPELTDERMAEIKERIKRGYYKRTDVLQRIAKRVTDQLSR